MKTLFVSDLDGTLLTAKETVSEYSMRLLNKLIDEDGVLFTYATARSLNSAAKAVWGLRQNLPVILYNGAIVMEPWNGNKLYNSHFTGTVRADIRRILHEYDVWPLVYSFLGNKERVSWLRGRETEGMKRYLSRRAGDPRLNPVDSPDELKDDEIFYYTYIDAKERTDVLHAVFEKDARFRCIYQQETYQSDYWLEIMPAGTSKGAAATVLKERLGAEKTRRVRRRAQRPRVVPRRRRGVCGGKCGRGTEKGCHGGDRLQRGGFCFKIHPRQFGKISLRLQYNAQKREKEKHVLERF